MRRLTLILMATAALAACGDATPDVAPAPAATAPAAPALAAASPTATYALATADAVARWREVDTMGEPVPAAGQAQDCNAHIGRQISVLICSIDGRVASMVATSRTGATAEVLDRSLVTMAQLVAPDAEPADLTRIAASAAEGLAGAGTVLCPTISCFRIAPLSDGWVMGAHAGQP